MGEHRDDERVPDQRTGGISGLVVAGHRGEQLLHDWDIELRLAPAHEATPIPGHVEHRFDALGVRSRYCIWTTPRRSASMWLPGSCSQTPGP
jgi:hypothetical protein